MILLANFNSIKVQLRHLVSMLPLLAFYNFNSIKVQLRPARFNLSLVNSWWHFNSIKVQLRHDDTRTPLAYSKFQFHKGTIKTFIILYKLIPILHFNSIKVQLRHMSGTLSPDWQLIFQFHKGTIKTHRLILTCCVVQISIP